MTSKSPLEDFQDFLANQEIGEDARAATIAAVEDAYAAALVIAAPFLQPAGQACLAELRRRTIEQPTWTPGSPSGTGEAREGQNSMVRFIETCLAVAKRGPPEQSSPSATTDSKRS